MNRIVGLITFVVFLLFIAGGFAAVLLLGTSTGLAMGGTTSKTGATALDVPFQTQTGWIRNNSPWPVEITSVDVNDTGTASEPIIYLSKTNDEPVPAAGVVPTWATTPATLPYTLPGGALRYFGFSVTPASGKIATFDEISVAFKGPIDYSFDSDYSGVAVAVIAADLAPDLLAADPSDDPGSLDTYVGILRTALASGDAAQVQAAMGDGTTPEQAQALLATQAGFTADMPVLANATDDDARRWSVQFYRTDAATDGLPALTAVWKDFRWNLTVAG